MKKITFLIISFFMVFVSDTINAQSCNLLSANNNLGGPAHGPGFQETDDINSATLLSNGNFVAAWETRDDIDGNGNGGFFQVFNEDGTPVTGTIMPYADINAAGVGDQGLFGPKVVALNTGFVIAFTSEDGPGDTGAVGDDQQDVLFRVYDNAGAPISGTSRLSIASQEDKLEYVLPLSTGGFVIATSIDEDDTGNNDDYFFRAFNASGVATSGIVNISSGLHDAAFQNDNNEDMMIDLGGGNFAVAWEGRDDIDGDEIGAFFRIFNTSGTAVTGIITPYTDINPGGTGRQGSGGPMLKNLTNGNFIVAWESEQGPGDLGPGGGFEDDQDIYFRIYSATGTAITGTIKANSDLTADEEQLEEILVLTGGNFAVLYSQDEDETGNKDDFFIRVFTESGAAVSVSFEISSGAHTAGFTTVNNDGDALAALSNGNFVVGWATRDDIDGDDAGAFYRVFNSNGAAVTAVATPYADSNPTGIGRQSTNGAKVKALEGGGFMVGWQSLGGPGDVGPATDEQDVYHRVYTNTGTALCSTTKTNTGNEADEEILDFVLPLADGKFAVVYKADEDTTGNKDDFFVRVIGDPVMALSNIIVNGTNGNLEFTDNDDRDDNLTITVNGANYRLTDPDNPLTAGAGATQIDANTVEVPIASVTGTIEIATQGGDDSLTSDFSGGNFTDIINYDGGLQNNTNPGDILRLEGGSSFTRVEHLLTNESDGSIGITGSSTINYLGLEPVIDNLNVVDRVFSFTGAAETITIQNDATPGFNIIDSTLAESVTFLNPTNSLTIRTEFFSIPGIDTINIQGLDAAFDADLTVNAGAEDTVDFNTNPTAIGTGNYDINSQIIDVSQNVSTTMAGNISITATQNIVVDSSANISAENGDITIDANTTGTFTGANTDAIVINDGNILTTGTGNITVTGIGFGDGTGSTHRGIFVTNNAQINTSGGGNITVNGTGGVGENSNQGVFITGSGTMISTLAAGNISITGTGGNGTGNFNEGCTIVGGAIIRAANTGAIDIQGTGGNGANVNKGVVFFGAGTQVQTNGGGITITGQGAGSGNSNFGISIEGNSLIEDLLDGIIVLNGIAGDGTGSGNTGINVNNSTVRSNGGGITANGTAGSGVGTGNFNRGVFLTNMALLEDIDDGEISITGQGGTGLDGNSGVFTNNAIIQSNNGGITVNGTAGDGNRNFNRGISLEQGTRVEAILNGAITLTGQGGTGDGTNNGILVTSSSIVRSNGGGITVNGIAGDGTGNSNQGVVINNMSNVTDISTGNILLTGQGGTGVTDNTGIIVSNAMVTSNGGGITANGTAGDGTGNSNQGVVINNMSNVTDTSTGNILLTGQGGTGVTENTGIILSNAMVTSNGGGITANGTAGDGTGNSNQGVVINNMSNITDTSTGDILLTGQGGIGDQQNRGVEVQGADVTVTTNGGNIIINGTANINTFGIFNLGASVRNGAQISTIDTGSITINGTGGGGTGNNRGVEVTTLSTVITTVDGNLTLSGNGGDSAGGNNIGTTILDEALVETTGLGTIFLTGQGGTGTGSNNGLNVNNAIVRSNGGGITANGTAGDGTGNSNIGVNTSNNAIIEDLSGGDILINGTGAGTGENDNYGIFIATAISTTTGNITMTGVGSSTSTNAQNAGTRINGTASNINTQDGTITLNGTGGTGTGSFNAGNLILFGANIGATGSGSITLNGQGGASGNQFAAGNYFQSNVTLAINGGDLSIIGTGGGGDFFSFGNNISTNTSIIDNGAGTITISGAGGTGVQINRGNSIENAQITSNGGDISILGTGQPGPDGFNQGTAISGAAQIIATSGAGTINISGTGATGEGFSDNGIIIFGNTQINTEDGALQIDGVALDASVGVIFDEGSITTTGSGNIILNGTTTDANLAAINITQDVATINAGGNLIASATIGKINTPEGIPATTTFTAMTNTFNGVLAPGQSPGLLLVAGDFNLSSGDTFEVEIDNATTPGTDYDQVAVTGVVDITDATLSLIDNIMVPIPTDTEFIIIDNDGADAVIGTFNGLPEGANISFNDQFFVINYDGGDGNDVVLVETASPIPMCQDITVQLDASGAVTILPTQVDNGSTGPTGTVMLALDIDTFTCADIGPNVVTLTVTNETGITATCTATVTVEDMMAPTVMCQNITVTLDDTGMATITAADIDSGSTDNCGNVTLSINIDTFDCNTSGDNNVTLTVTDDSGLSANCVAVVTVIDPLPTAICQDITVLLDANGQASITAAQINNGSNDACGISEVSIDITDFDCTNLGENTVTLTVTDTNGNDAQCEATVTVTQDNPTPVAICQNITIALGQNGMATILPSTIDAGSTGEGCTNGITINTNTFTCDDIGINEVTLTVTNGNGETDSCVALVNVVDTLSPVITCPDDIVIFAATDPFELPDFVDNATVIIEDNCEDNLIITQDPEAGTLVNAGETDIEITVIDSSGNESSCDFTILVDPSLGTDNYTAQLKTLSLYPNPASDFIVLENPNSLELREAKLIDVTGRIVKLFNLNESRVERILDISEIASASYFLIVEGTEGSVSFQVIKR